MMFPHMDEEKVCCSGSRDHCDSGNKMCMLGDVIDNNHDGIVLHRLWQLDNEVHADSVLWSRQNGKRVDFSGWRMSEWLGSKAHVTAKTPVPMSSIFCCAQPIESCERGK